MEMEDEKRTGMSGWLGDSWKWRMEDTVGGGTCFIAYRPGFKLYRSVFLCFTSVVLSEVATLAQNAYIWEKLSFSKSTRGYARVLPCVRKYFILSEART